ncbi:hypothetical protein ACLK19_09645 [Escherichia coli]
MMGKVLRFTPKEANNIPWKAKGAEIIVECTGFYTSARNRRRILMLVRRGVHFRPCR